jgi:hypothetical protein
MQTDQIEEGQTSSSIWSFDIVLSVLLLLDLLALCCLSFFYLICWHCVVYPSSIWSVGIVFSVLLLFDLLTLYCLSFFYLIFWHCVVCPSSIWSVGIVLSAILLFDLLGIVLSVLLLFDLLALCCLSFFYLICWHCVVCLSSTDQIEEGQTTQCQKIK